MKIRVVRLAPQRAFILLGLAVTGVALVLACGETSAPTGPVEGPEAQITDVLHSSGKPHFYFLPPMVSAPVYSGTFDPALAPTVQICMYAAGDCSTMIAEFTTTTGPGSETVRLDASNELYIVNWRTDRFRLNPALTYRIRVLVGTSELGFADVDLVSSAKELRTVQTSQFVPLLNGTTLPIKVRIEQGIPGALTVDPANARIGGQQTQRIGASLLDLHGVSLAGAVVAWDVATVPPEGVADAVHPLDPTQAPTGSDGQAATVFTAGVHSGLATVTARVGGLSSSATIQVTAARISVNPAALTFHGVKSQSALEPQSIAVDNAGGGTLTGLTVGEIAYGERQPVDWLTGTFDHTTAPAALIVHTNVGNLAPGTYTATIPVASSVAENSPQNVTVTLVLDPPPSIALQPANLHFHAAEGQPAGPAQSVAITNKGGGSIGHLVRTIAYGSGQPSGWLSATLNQTTAPTTLIVSAAMGTLDGGTYTANVDVSSTDADNSPQSIHVTLAVNRPPVVRAGDDQTVRLPSSASLNGNVTDDGVPTGSALTLTWSRVSGPGSVSFDTPNAAVTAALFSAPGTYVVRLSASDGELSSSDDVTVTVEPNHNAFVSVTGGGSGFVGSNFGLSCPRVGCSASVLVAPGTYQLNAYAQAGSYFAGWGGDAASCGTERTCNITVGTAPVNVTARFEPGLKLTILTSGYIGGALIYVDPSPGTVCGSSGQYCTYWFGPGSTVRLFTRDFGGYTDRANGFLSWSGVSGCGTGDDCVITFGTTDVTVTANFKIPVFVAVEGSGSGQVTTNPAGIDCSSGTFCGPLSLTPGQTVTFTATPNAGSVVDHWDTYNTNDVDRAVITACGSATTCTITPTGYLHVRVVWGPAP